MTAMFLIKPLNLVFGVSFLLFSEKLYMFSFLFFSHLLFSLPLSTRVSFLYSCAGPARTTLDKAVSLLHPVFRLLTFEV